MSPLEPMLLVLLVFVFTTMGVILETPSQKNALLALSAILSFVALYCMMTCVGKMKGSRANLIR